MNKTIIIVIVVAVIVIGVLGFLAFKPNTFGGVYHNVLEYFDSGIQLGSESQVACIRIEDTDKGGYSYVTVLNGAMTVTGGVAGAFTIPSGCAGK